MISLRGVAKKRRGCQAAELSTKSSGSVAPTTRSLPQSNLLQVTAEGRSLRKDRPSRCNNDVSGRREPKFHHRSDTDRAAPHRTPARRKRCCHGIPCTRDGEPCRDVVRKRL